MNRTHLVTRPALRRLFPTWPTWLCAASALTATAAWSAEPVAGCHAIVAPPAQSASGTPPSPSARTGFASLRRHSAQLWRLDVSVTTADGSNCAVSGVLKRGTGTQSERWVMPVRPDSGTAAGRALCWVAVQPTATGLALSTSGEACRAQGLCGSRVELDGLPFERQADAIQCPGETLVEPRPERKPQR